MAEDYRRTDEEAPPRADADAFIDNLMPQGQPIDPKYLILPESESVQNHVAPDRAMSDWGQRQAERRRAIIGMAERQDMLTGDLASPRAPILGEPVSQVWNHPLMYPPLPTGLTGQIGAPEAIRKNKNLQFGDDIENAIDRLDEVDAIPDKQIREELPRGSLWRDFDPRAEKRYREMVNRANDRYLDHLVRESIDDKGHVYDGRSAPTQSDVNRLKKEPSPENIRAFEKQFGRGSARAYL